VLAQYSHGECCAILSLAFRTLFSVTYLQRYTLIGSFGIITADEDTDGRLADASSEYITSEQVTEIDELIKLKSANKERFLKFFKVAKIDDIRATQFTRAVRMLQQKKAS